jgi:tetratricopeptide (TPR) repeat protein
MKAISKDYIGGDDQRIPRVLTGLGNSLSQLKRFDEALEAQLEAKRLCGDVPPEQSDAITIIQLNLGFLLYRRGDLNNAEKILRATLEASPRTPPAMYALGNTLLAKGSIEEAIATHLEGLEIYIDMFGDQHALVGRCAYKIGEILLLYKSDARTARSVSTSHTPLFCLTNSNFVLSLMQDVSSKSHQNLSETGVPLLYPQSIRASEANVGQSLRGGWASRRGR